MRKLMIKILILLTGLLISQEVFSVDELYLTGVIKSYHKEKGLIWVDVRSEGCKGLREFRIPDSMRLDLDPSLVGHRINFFINSPKCEPGHVYNLIPEVVR